MRIPFILITVVLVGWTTAALGAGTGATAQIDYPTPTTWQLLLTSEDDYTHVPPYLGLGIAAFSIDVSGVLTAENLTPYTSSTGFVIGPRVATVTNGVATCQAAQEPNSVSSDVIAYGLSPSCLYYSLYFPLYYSPGAVAGPVAVFQGTRVSGGTVSILQGQADVFFLKDDDDDGVYDGIDFLIWQAHYPGPYPTEHVNVGPNQPPQVSAGPDAKVMIPNALTLAGSVSDDGLPIPPGTCTAAWSMVLGPGTVTFANPAAASTTATFSTAGTYVLQLTASDSALMAASNVTVTALAPGDFNGDGKVDGVDFLIWQAHYPTASGATPDIGDANGDGKVDGTDFLIWQANYHG